MKIFANTLLLAAACLMVTSGSQANAQTTTQQNNVQQRDSKNPTGNQAGKMDAMTNGSSIRASQLIGMNIQNAAKENVGEINDLVIDAQSGRVAYAAVTYGGFIGIGNKMHAVPMAAFKFTQDPDDKDDMILVLNVTQKQMEGATGFDEDHWPSLADEKFRSEVAKRYNVEMHRQESTNTSRSSYNKSGK